MKPSSRGKKQPPEPLSKWEGAQVEVVLAQLACWGVGGLQPKTNTLVIQVAVGNAPAPGPKLSTFPLGKPLHSRMPKTTKKASESVENPSKIELWAFLGTPLGATWAPLGQHLGHMPPKDWILEALGRVLGVQDIQHGSNLEVPGPQNRSQSPKKPMIKNNTFFASIFGGFRRRFGRVFLRFSEPRMHTTSETLKCVKS